MADVSGAIARLVLLKAYLNATTSTNDSFYKQMLISASRAIDTECNRKFVKQEYTDEVYTAQFGQERLYLRNWPVIGAIDSIKFGTTAQTVGKIARKSLQLPAKRLNKGYIVIYDDEKMRVLKIRYGLTTPEEIK